MGFLKQNNDIFHHLWSLEKLLYFHALNCILRYALLLFLPYCLIIIEHLEVLFYYFIQTFSSLLFLQENVYLSIRIDLLRVYSFKITSYWKQLSPPFFGFIVIFSFFIHSNKSIYNPLQFKLIWWYLQYSLSKTKSLHFTDSSKPIKIPTKKWVKI